MQHLDIKIDSEVEQLVYQTIDDASDELRSVSLEVNYQSLFPNYPTSRQMT